MKSVLLVMVATSVCVSSWAAGGTAPWYERLNVGIEVGPTGAQYGCDPGDTTYACRFNGREIVEKAEAANCEYVVIWAKDSEFAYYNSKVAPKCPGLGERDVLREAADAAKGLNLPVIAYCVVQGNGYPLRDHPEFKMTDKDGKPIDRICFNSWYMDHAKAVAAEMLEYGIAGFHIDMIDQGFGPPYGCWCPNCRRLFEAEYGEPMPAGATWDAAWDRMLEFRYNTSQRFERELRGYLREKAPDVTVDFNYHGYPPFSFEVGQRPVQHAVNADFVTAETGVWGFGALGVSLTAEFLAAATPGKRYQVAMSRHARIYHDNTCRPLNDIRWELLTLLAHGAQVTVVDKTGYDGWLDPVAYERIGKAFAEAREKAPFFGHKQLPEVGLYYSARSRDWYGRETPANYQQAFNGAHKVMMYEHIPFAVILDENVSAEKLRAFPVVLLPNVPILSEREVELLRAYVEQGGNLIVTGQTGLLGWMGEPLDRSVLEELIGAKMIERLKTTDNFARFGGRDPERFREGYASDWPFLVEGPAAAYSPTTATAVGELMRPARTVRQQRGQEPVNQPNSADKPVGPALLVNAVGKGKVVCIAGAPDFATSGEHPIPEARALLRNVVRYLNPEPVVEVTAPQNVEAVVMQDETTGALLVHLLGYQSPPQCTPPKNRPYVLPALIEDPPMYRASITVRRPFAKATAHNPQTSLSVEGQTVRVVVNDIHEVVEIR
ncbi:MAG: beta-galactosidase trimerization domain-containing protein [Candidatus Hydrogenedentes bacterium]|nr:beta-galactosidase trimerization domain-containing protein [Candidatus Hydrogenedentota bacterium]